jgi:hypothetical protein
MSLDISPQTWNWLPLFLPGHAATLGLSPQPVNFQNQHLFSETMQLKHWLHAKDAKDAKKTRWA